MHTLLHKPTMVWKSLVVGYTPRTITNNAVGNWFMYAFRNIPNGNGVRAIGDAMRFSFGPKVLDDPVFGHSHFMHRYFSNELADQFGVGNEITRLGADEIGGRAKWKSRLRQGVYPAVAATAERPLRVASIYKALRDMPEVQAEIKRLRSRGVKGQVAVDRGIERALRKHPHLQGEASLESRRIAGDYVTMSNAEKWARDIIPFYLWNRHILKNTGNMLLEQPARLAVASRTSQLGIDQTEQWLGTVPDFMRGAIPLAALGFGQDVGRANVLLTASLNPYATVGDLAETVNAWTTGRGRRTAALSQFNPYLTEAAASIFQVNTLTGAPQPRSGSILGGIAKGTWDQLPYTKLVKQALGEDTRVTPKGNDYLYAKTKKAQVTSLFGIPIRDVSLERAQQLADQLSGTKTKKGGSPFS
ncbi:MAG: hypothetical protein LC118_08065 [Dehalococcoidia bacterium]|nr:hypothetical protein [Dehalococcoidia bacterium]